MEPKDEILLYQICFQRVLKLLKVEAWKKYKVNPFLNLPSKMINDLIEHFSNYELSIEQALPVLKSGSLTRLQLSGHLLLGEYEIFQDVIETNCLKNLRILFVYEGSITSMYMVEKFILSCPKLEEFYCCKFINLNSLENCKELRVLKFDYMEGMDHFMFSPRNLSVLSSLKNLRNVFFFASMNSDAIADLLKHCPQLTSIGYVDSLSGLEKTNVNTARQCETDHIQIPSVFQLRKCVWGMDTRVFDTMVINELDVNKTNFPEKVRNAVSLCPFVEDLVIYVYHADSLESLKNLKYLVNLKINFYDCDGGYMTKLPDLFKIIGAKLKILFIESCFPVPVDIICECCPQLASLAIMNSATATWPAPPLGNSFMRKIGIRIIDQSALLALLSNCQNLEELVICDATCLDDGLLAQILKLNSFAKLRICDIRDCSLSRNGFRMFLEKTPCLERVKFISPRNDIVEKLIEELNLEKVIYGQMFNVPNCQLGTNF